ncbi:Putative SH3 domain-containing protein [Septoria linicola]|uniref:SH3 domain-containing protein n=1 Tax=Septoria linicola TaxID=215465 RepID=A0A9Q9EIG9_9PEZI|nr:Putative SH3 domain-containing protein [Septoria linicola]
MTRPNIVRADTLDLQDQQSPTAAEHAKHPAPNGNAPHLAAQVQHVLEERHSEEKTLAEAWDTSANLDDRPTTTSNTANANANANNAQDRVTNGQNGEEGAGDAEGESDDDMMDRISSSPSIEDGGYSSISQRAPFYQLRVQDWPARSTSLSSAASTPTSTPTRESFNQTADMTPDSSPFLSTPQHLPLRSRMGGLDRSPLANVSSPDESPFRPARRSRIVFIASKHHHGKGRYEEDIGKARTPDFEPPPSSTWTGERVNTTAYGSKKQTFTFEDQDDRLSDISGETRSPIASPFRRHSFMRSTTDLTRYVHKRSPSLSSVNSLDMETVLLPVNDPLLDTPLSPADSNASWESMPEAISDHGDEDYTNEDDDDDHDAFLDLDPQFIDYGWDCECLHEAEDIDFEFVYALHTFVATVEGQANATKGDTMVLLDDSNSYWWLVRVVKDSSIGYLPAEHIETPTERLARLNKHRNIDLSATMLSDNSEKSRNPLKKAMRRRNAKTVQFAAPTYVEASDYDYSSDDEENMIEPSYGAAQHVEEAAKEEPEAEADKAQKAEVEHPEAERRSSTGSNRASFDREQAATAAQALVDAGVTGDGPKTGELAQFGFDASSIPTVATEAAPLKSKRTRNTDSFLKDDKIDTVRITLTPSMLREEQANNAKSPSSETARSSSFEELKPTSSPTESTTGKKDEKKKKEEKPKKSGGMLSGLFKSKKKDKKAKDVSSDADSEKVSAELQREGSLRGNSSLSGKLSPIDKSSISTPSAFRHDYHEPGPDESLRQSSSQDSSQAAFVAELEGSSVAHEMGTASPENDPARQTPAETEEQQTKEAPPLENTSSISKPLAMVQNSVAPITNMLHLGDKEGKPTKAKKAKQRVELDDFDSPVDEPANPFDDQNQEKDGDRLSESPVEISSHTFMHGTESIHIPNTYHEEGAEEGDDEEGPESLSSSPSIIEHPAEPSEDEVAAGDEDDDSTPTARSPLPPQEKAAMAARDAARAGTKSPIVAKPASPPRRGMSTDSNTSKSSSAQLSPPSSRPSPTVSQQSWSDDSLKAWLEDGSEVRDMLVMINDKSGIKPVAANHPLMIDLFTQERKGVQDMMGQLDGLLGSYLQRKGVRF